MQRREQNSVTLVSVFQFPINLSVPGPEWTLLGHRWAFLSGRSSSLSSMVTLAGTGPSAAVAALEDLGPHHRQSRGRAALRVS